MDPKLFLSAQSLSPLSLDYLSLASLLLWMLAVPPACCQTLVWGRRRYVYVYVDVYVYI